MSSTVGGLRDNSTDGEAGLQDNMDVGEAGDRGDCTDSGLFG